MSDALPIVYLARHGETAWSLSGQHTGLTDIPLTPRGEQNAKKLGAYLKNIAFDQVLTSPLQRARRTCELAGFASRAELDSRLVEWNYGECEGRTTSDIQRQWPDWRIFRDGCPGGESVAEIGARADAFIARLRGGPASGDSVAQTTLVFSSAHILRVIAARWLGLDASCGRLLTLGTASVSILGYEHSLAEPVLRRWNDTTAAEH